MPTRSGREPSVLVVASGGAQRESVLAALKADSFRVSTVETAEDVPTALVREPVAAALVHQTFGLKALSQVLARASALQPPVPVVVLGTSADASDAVEAFRAGASDYLPAPIEGQVLVRRLKALLASPHEPGSTEGSKEGELDHVGMAGLIGRSPAMRKLYETIQRISRYKANVLLLGESGTGKELVARALHGRGPHRQHLFVPLNCAALSREIIENELFGHERGAFTGANERKKGLFELADGGTLFLDEIAEMDVSTQAKLLRVLERNEFRRLGGTGKIKVDVGIIAATNRTLENAIVEGRFREDLYYRLKVVTLNVPPLRARKEDIPALVESFISDFNRRNDGKIKGIAPQALRRLMEHDWPGNVRELKNTVENAAVLAVTDTIADEAIAEILNGTRRRSPAAQARDSRDAEDGAIRVPFGATLAEAEQRIIAEYLTRFGTRAETARALGIGLRTLYTKISDGEAAGASSSPRRPKRRAKKGSQ